MNKTLQQWCMTGSTADILSDESRSNRDCCITFQKIDSDLTRKTYRRIIDLYHGYKNWSDYVGRRLMYLILADSDYIGAIGIASSPLSIGKRDAFIGWNKEQKMKNINKIAVNYRYCLIESGWSPFVLKAFIPQVRKDWKEFYGDNLVLLETMIEPPYTGVCYKANGWQYIGDTKGTTIKRPPSKAMLNRALDGNEGRSHRRRAELVNEVGFKEASKMHKHFTITTAPTKPKLIYVKPLHRYWQKELLRLDDAHDSSNR